MSELAKRVVVAAVGIPLVIAAVYLGRWVLAALIAVAAAIGALEFYRLAAMSGVRAFPALGAVSAALFVLTGAFRPAVGSAAPILVGIAVAGLPVSAAWSIRAPGVDGPPFATAVTFGLSTRLDPRPSVLLRHELPDRARPAARVRSRRRSVDGARRPRRRFDVDERQCAYHRHGVGRRRLSPRVSPGKSVEGAVAGVAGGVLFGGAFAELALGDLWVRRSGRPGRARRRADRRGRTGRGSRESPSTRPE